MPVAYLVGSIPWGIIVVRFLLRIDIRNQGSGNTGVTNVLRTAGKWPALFTLIGDTGKGIAIVLLARSLSADPYFHALLAGIAILGHIWPVWVRFRGGKGIATGIGIVAILDPVLALVGIVIFVSLIARTRLVSLGSVCGTLALIVLFGLSAIAEFGHSANFWFSLGAGSLVIFRHRDNINRLIKGTEHKLERRTEIRQP
jgi:glycerol-3-phosphate acyltransferase PlsY